MEAQRKLYACGICGKAHDSVQERAKCETACIKKQEEEAKKAADEKKLQEKGVRYARILKLRKELYEEVQNYLNDYGSIHFDDDKITDSGYLSTLNKLLGWYW